MTVATETRTDAPCGLGHLLLVAADDARCHQRVAQSGRVPAALLAGFVERLLALASLI